MNGGLFARRVGFILLTAVLVSVAVGLVLAVSFSTTRAPLPSPWHDGIGATGAEP